MTRYMVVCSGKEVSWAQFFDSYKEAQAYAYNAECGVGLLVELYEYESGEGYLRIS